MLTNSRAFKLKVAGGLLVCLCLLTVGYASDDHNTARWLKESGNIMPLAKILEAVSSWRPGRVLEVELQDNYGRPVYAVELVDVHGVVWYLQFDAIQGTLLHMQQEKAP
ncbi:MAG TPA: hypothetical protein VIH59_15965 [Candidatus Tectomicrobia bacterium]|jgi:uncharacterized membrane protein YkoI